MSSQQYGMDPNQFAQSLDQDGQIPAMVAEVARRKALATVLEKVSVKDTAGNVIDLNESVPGTEDFEIEEIDEDDDSTEATAESAEKADA
jgi:trigger factor